MYFQQCVNNEVGNLTLSTGCYFNFKSTVASLIIVCFKICDLQIARESHSTRRGTQRTQRNSASVEQLIDSGIHCSLN